MQFQKIYFKQYEIKQLELLINNAKHLNQQSMLDEL